MAAVDRFAFSGLQTLETPPEHAYAITPNDGVDLVYVTTHISAATAGLVNVITKGGETTPIPVAAGIQTKVRAVRVLATGTTATGIVGFD